MRSASATRRVRGAAPGLHVPVFCHPLDREAAESSGPLRSYPEAQIVDDVRRRPWHLPSAAVYVAVVAAARRRARRAPATWHRDTSTR